MTKVFSTLGVKGVLDELLPRFQRAHTGALELTWDPTVLMLARVKTGERADLALLTSEGIDELIASGVLARGSRVDLARSHIGIAVAAGAAKPDISSVDAVRRALLAARSIAYSKTGASGIFFAGLIARLGIADAVNAKATITAGGFTAEVVAAGKAELAVQQVSELMVVPGVDIVGPLPQEIQENLMFSGGIFAGAADAAGASRLLAFLARTELAEVYRAKGLLPV